MSNRKLQEFREYRYGPRGVLCPGDLFRVSGGPVYENGDGTKSLMAERGTFKFLRYCVKGADKWIEAHRVGGSTVVLWVGKAGRNPELPSFRRKPYKVRKLTERKRRGKKKQGAGQKVDGSGPVGAADTVTERKRQRNKQQGQKVDALGPAGASGKAAAKPKSGKGQGRAKPRRKT